MIHGGRWDGLIIESNRPVRPSSGEFLSLITATSSKLDNMAGNDIADERNVILMAKELGKAVEI